MARIGTRKKIDQNRKDLYKYENDNGTKILIFLMPETL